MKRLNRKKIIETLMIARQGYEVLFNSSVEDGNINIQVGCSAQHHNLNKMIGELGGEKTSDLNPVFNSTKTHEQE